MTDKMEVINPLTPLAYLKPEAAYQFQMGTYVIIGCIGAFVWDILENIHSDYRLAFRRKMSFPTIVYFLSRFSVLASVLMNAISRTAPLGARCQNAQTAACILYHIALSSTALLFFLRARAIFSDNRRMIVFFLILWLSVVAGSITVTFVGGSGPLGPTDYCLAKPLKQYITVSPVTLFVNDTCVFLAISWRLMSLSQLPRGLETQSRITLKRFILGRDLPALSRTLFQDGQVYYLVSIVSNILGIITTTPVVSSGFRYMYVFNSIITNMMACRVYRHIKFGDFREDSISTSIGVTPLKLDTAKVGHFTRFPRHHTDVPMTVSGSTVLDSMTTSEDVKKRPEDSQRRRLEQWHSRILFILITALMIFIPVICISVCMHRRHMQASRA